MGDEVLHAIPASLGKPERLEVEDLEHVGTVRLSAAVPSPARSREADSTVLNAAATPAGLTRDLNSVTSASARPSRSPAFLHRLGQLAAHRVDLLPVVLKAHHVDQPDHDEHLAVSRR